MTPTERALHLVEQAKRDARHTTGGNVPVPERLPWITNSPTDEIVRLLEDLGRQVFELELRLANARELSSLLGAELERRGVTA